VADYRLPTTDYRLLDRQSVRRRDAGLSRRRWFAINELLELLARLEVRHLLRRHVDLVARLRVPALARFPFAQAEAAKAPQLDFLAAVQRVDDALEHRVDDDLGVFLGQIGHARDFLDEFRLGHAAAVHGWLLDGAWKLGVKN